MDYTKGPWKHEGNKVVNINNEEVFYIFPNIPNNPCWISFHKEGNQKLLLAAPDMYEALKAITQCCLVTEYSAEYRLELMAHTANIILSKLEGKEV